MPYHDDPPLSRIRVHLRLRPSVKPSPAINVQDETATVLIDVQKNSGGGPPKPYVDQIVFNMDSIVQTTNQQTLYELCAKASVDDFLKGYNATIMAYGQVGAGKTFTMTGDMKVYVHRGIIPRSIHQIFDEKEARPEAGIVVHMSYMEIYQEGIFDLLQQRSDNLMIIEENNLPDVRGLAKERVETEAEALRWFFEGEKSRSYGHHFLNPLSSRSHTILTFYMERRVHSNRTEQDLTVAKLNLVDLAGVERLKKTTGDSGTLMRKEACVINKSLSFLEQTVYALRLGQGYVPFRQSKVTTLLKESLGGNCKTVLMVCCWPEEFFLDETIGALRFAQRVKYLKTFSVTNKKPDCSKYTRRQRKEIATLKQELTFKNALSGRPGISYDNLTEEVKTKLKETIQDYLQNDEDLDSIRFDNIKQVKELFCIFKEEQIFLQVELDRVLRYYGLFPQIAKPPIEEDDGVGRLTYHGFNVGVASPTAHPNTSHTLNPNAKCCGVIMMEYKETDAVPDVWKSGYNFREEAFEEYKRTNAKGREQEAILKIKKTELKAKRQYARDLCELCNEIRQEIQQIKKTANKKQGTLDFDLDTNNNKTNLLNRYKIVKIDFQKTFSDIQLQKDVIKKLSQEIRDQKSAYLESFYFWYNAHDKYRGKDIEEFLIHLGKKMNSC